MITYDAFSFIQVTVILFILLGLAMSLWRRFDEHAREEQALPAEPVL
jgi:hypothetical protein